MGAGYKVQSAGCIVQSAGCRVQGAGCRVQGAGFRAKKGFLVAEAPRIDQDIHRSNHVSLRTAYRGTSLIRNTPLPGPYIRAIPRVLWWSGGGGAVSYERGTPAPTDSPLIEHPRNYFVPRYVARLYHHVPHDLCAVGGLSKTD